MKLWNCGNEQCAIAETGNLDATTILVPRWSFPKFHNCTFLIGLLGDSDDIPLLSRFASDSRRASAVEASSEGGSMRGAPTPSQTFNPRFDDDGNQTLIKTATGIWSATYNGKNRPVRWVNGDMVITMSFDRMGRRVTKNAQRFIYDGYLQIENFELASTNSQLTTHNLQLFIWDPTEPVATRPLVWGLHEGSASLNFEPSTLNFYTHDGNKNVSEVVARNSDVAAHYVYAPSGSAIAQHGASAASNPWRFSSEFAEDDTATVYYNYRSYNFEIGLFTSRDMLTERLYTAFCNSPVSNVDFLGLVGKSVSESEYKKQRYRIQTQKVVCLWEWDKINHKCNCQEPCHWEDVEAPEEQELIIATIVNTYMGCLSASEIAHGIASEVSKYLVGKIEGRVEDLILDALIKKSLPSLPFWDEISALGDSEYLPYLSANKHNGLYYLKHTSTRTFQYSRDVPNESHMIVPSCSHNGEIESIGEKIGSPYWTRERGF